MKTYYALLLTTAGLLAGCGPDHLAIDPHVVMRNDFETMSGWMPDAQTATITKERAHSGRYCLKVSPGHEYSVPYNKPLRQLFDTRPSKIHLSGWALVSSTNTAASLVTSIAVPGAPGGKPVLWKGLDLLTAVKTPNKWVKVSQTIDLPDNIAPESILSIYLWGTGPDAAYFDDIELRQE